MKMKLRWPNILCRYGFHRMIAVTEHKFSSFSKDFVKSPGRYKACLHCCYCVRLKEVISTWESIEPK